MANSTFSEMSLKCLLLGGFKHDFYDFHVIYGTILPIDFNIFQRGRYTTNQISSHGDLGIHHFKKHKNIKQYSSLSPTFPHCNFPSHRILCFCKSWLHPPVHKNILMRRRRRVLGGISFYIHSPYIDLIHGRYLQIRFLKWPLIFWVFVAGKKTHQNPGDFLGKISPEVGSSIPNAWKLQCSMWLVSWNQIFGYHPVTWENRWKMPSWIDDFPIETSMFTRIVYCHVWLLSFVFVIAIPNKIFIESSQHFNGNVLFYI